MTARLTVPAACALAALAVAGCGGGKSNGNAFGGPTEVRGKIPTTSQPPTRKVLTTKGTAPAHTPIPVTESDFSIVLGYRAAHAGRIEFDAHNAGTMDHELVVIRTDRPAAKLLVDNGVVDTAKAGKVMALLQPYPALSTKKLDVTLKAGHYALICNLPGHYAKGMHADFTVR